MIYNLEDLIKAYNAGEKLRYLFFWGHTPKTMEREKLIGLCPDTGKG